MWLKSKSAIAFRYKMIINLSLEGKKQAEIASIVECDRSLVSLVQKRYKSEGESMFGAKEERRGKACKLEETSLNELKNMLQAGALFYNFPTDNWTRERIKKLIEDRFGVCYSAAHISDLVKKLGFTLQKPIHKSYQKPEQDVKEWKENILPSLKKS